jgi:hypothetical protein
MIRIFYHVAAMLDWQSVVAEQWETICSSGLASVAGSIDIGVAGTQADVETVQDITGAANVTIHGPYPLQHYEYPTLRLVRNMTQTGDQVLYLHTKGVSHRGEHRLHADEWRRYMMWGCVERWAECVEALSDHDMAGVQWTRLGNSYVRLCGAKQVWAGNVWWARGDYLRKLPAPAIDKNRYLAEGWTAKGSPRICELHNLTGGSEIRSGRRPTGPNVPGFGRHVYENDAKRPARQPLTFDEVWPYKLRIDIINDLIERRKYTRYLEIGVKQGHCFKAVKCQTKHGCDPAPCVPVSHKMTSDAFFASSQDVYDIIFIDGLHTAEQVAKDIDNGLQHLAHGGCLVLHDCLPETQFHTRAYEEYEKDGMIWTGTVWETWALFRMTRQDLRMRVVDVDFGVGVIDRGSQQCYPRQEITWGLYERNKRELMNMLTPAQYKREMDNA